MTLHEAKEIIEGTSFIKVNRAKKVSAFAGRSSITICKNKIHHYIIDIKGLKTYT